MSYSTADFAGIVIGLIIVVGALLNLAHLRRVAARLRSRASRVFGRRQAEMAFQPANLAVAAVLGLALGIFMITLGVLGGFA